MNTNKLLGTGALIGGGYLGTQALPTLANIFTPLSSKFINSLDLESSPLGTAISSNIAAIEALETATAAQQAPVIAARDALKELEAATPLDTSAIADAQTVLDNAEKGIVSLDADVITAAADANEAIAEAAIENPVEYLGAAYTQTLKDISAFVRDFNANEGDLLEKIGNAAENSGLDDSLVAALGPVGVVVLAALAARDFVLPNVQNLLNNVGAEIGLRR